MGTPLYALWQQTDEQHSPLVSALITDHQSIPRRFVINDEIILSLTRLVNNGFYFYQLIATSHKRDPVQ